MGWCSCEDPETGQKHLRSVKFGGALGIYLALLKKSARIFLRRPFLAVFHCVITPIMVVVTWGVNEYYVDVQGGINGGEYDRCGKPLDVEYDYAFNPFISSTLAAGPLIAGVLSTVFIQDEANSGLLVALLGSKRGFGAFWLSWWTLFTVIDLLVALISAGIAKALPDVIFTHVSFGAIFLSLFLSSGAVMFGFHIAVSFLVGFTKRSDVLVLIYLILFGAYFVTTLAPMFTYDKSLGVLQPENTTYMSCRSHVEESRYECGSVEACTSYLLLDNGTQYHGCWYLSSAQDAVWATQGSGSSGLELAVLFFIPTFHLTQIWTLIVGVVMLNGGTPFYASDYFYQSTATIIQEVMQLDEPALYVKVVGDEYESAERCSLDEPAQVQYQGIVGDLAPSIGASMGYLVLLSVVYLGGVLLLMYWRGRRVLRRFKLARNNKKLSQTCDDTPSNVRRGHAGSTALAVDTNRGLYMENVCLSFGKGRDRVQALQSLSLHVEEGRVMTFLGKNGAGKSTLIRILSSYLVQDSGLILCNGKPVSTVALGICMQDDALYNELSPAEHFKLWARLRMVPTEEIPEIVERWLRALNLYAMRNYKVETLSGGSRRRVSVGLATIGTPPLILLDEPTTGMDPINQRFVWRHIETIKAHSIVILSTHSMAEADSLADEVVIMEHGQIVASGTPLDLKLRYGSITQFALYVRPEDVNYVVEKLDSDFAPLFQHHRIEVRTVSSGYLTVAIHRRSTELAPHSSGDSTALASRGGQDDKEEDLEDDLGISLDVMRDIIPPRLSSGDLQDSLRDDARSERTMEEDEVSEVPGDMTTPIDQHPLSLTQHGARPSLDDNLDLHEDVIFVNRNTGESEDGSSVYESTSSLPVMGPKLMTHDTEDSTMLMSSRDDAIKSDPHQQLIEGMTAIINWIQTPMSRVREYGISNTTFEEVFLAIVEDSAMKREHEQEVERARESRGNTAEEIIPPVSTEPRAKGLGMKSRSENLSIVAPPSVRFAPSTISEPHPEIRPGSTTLQQKDSSAQTSTGNSASVSRPLHSVVQYLTVPDVSQLQIKGLRVKPHGLGLWGQQCTAMILKNFRVRLFSWEAIAKWIVAVLLLVSISLVESTNAELRTDVLVLSILICLVSILLIPFGVFEMNKGYLQIFKLHRCTFMSVSCSEFSFLTTVIFVITIVALSIFFAVTVSQGVHDEHLFYLCNQNETSCRCVVSTAEDSESRSLEVLSVVASLSIDDSSTALWYGYIQNVAGDWFMLLAIALAFSLSLGGFSLVINSLFRHHRMSAFFGGVLLVLWGMLPPVLMLRSLRDVMFIPNSTICSVATFGSLDLDFEYTGTTCAQRHMEDRVPSLNLLFSIGFSITMFDLFRDGTTTLVANSTSLATNTTNLLFAQNCTSDNSEFFKNDLGLFWTGAIITLVAGFSSFWLRTFPSESVLKIYQALHVCMHSICGTCDAMHRSAHIPEHRYTDDNTSETDLEESQPNETVNERMCVKLERSRVQRLVDKFDVTRPVQRDPIIMAGLSKTYHSRKGRVTALNSTYLAISPGEVVGLLGPNGSAKSTLCKLLNGTIPPTDGTAYIVGLDVQTQMTRILPHMGYVGQRDCLWKGLTAREHLNLVLSLRGVEASPEECRMLMDEVASRLDLHEYMDRKVSALSGGMQRRLSIALAMLGSPRVVILDEPTTQLDPSTRRKVWECIQYFRQSYRCAIIITTHSMEEADELCDRVCIITKGRFRAIDTPQGLKDRFGNGYVLILKVVPGRRREALSYVKGNICAQAVLGNCLNDVMRIYFPRDGFDISHAFALLFNERAHTEGYITNFLLNQATLHDVFMNIAGLDEAHLEEIGYLNENAHELVVKLLRHRGFRGS